MPLLQTVTASLCTSTLCLILAACDKPVTTKSATHPQSTAETTRAGKVLSARTCSCMNETRFRIQLKNGIIEITQLNSSNIKKDDKVNIIRDAQGDLRVEKQRK